MSSPKNILYGKGFNSIFQDIFTNVVDSLSTKVIDHKFDIAENPLHYGFLLKFCESEYSSENVKFLMAVDSFRDEILSRDSSTWNNVSWIELDKIYIKKTTTSEGSPTALSTYDSSSGKNYTWISRINQTEFDRLVNHIWTEYLSNESSNQICLPASVASSTFQRYKLKHLYGPEVFNEACIDPIKTIRRDILPRFMASTTFQFLQDQIGDKNLEFNLSSENMKYLLPDNDHFTFKLVENLPDNKEFELHEILECGILFFEFLSYLLASVSAENLLCTRMINIYEDLLLKTGVTASHQLPKRHSVFSPHLRQLRGQAMGHSSPTLNVGEARTKRNNVAVSSRHKHPEVNEEAVRQAWRIYSKLASFCFLFSL